LIEVVVVIGVVVLLLVILLPVVNHVRSAGRRTVCASNLSQIGKSFYAYANDNRGEIPAVYNSDKANAHPILWTRAVVEESGEGSGGIRLIVTQPMGIARQAYLRDASILVCPGERATFPVSQAGSNDFLHAPHNDSGMSYAYFYVPAVSDPRSQSANQSIWKKFERHSVNQRGAASLAVMSELTASNRRGRKNSDWHGPGGNVLYLDGHVAWIGRDVLPEEERYASENWMEDIDRAGRSQ